MKSNISSEALINLIQDYRAAYISSQFPVEFSLYSYEARVLMDRNPSTKLWLVYLEDRWLLPDNGMAINLANQAVKNSQVSGALLISALELLLVRTKKSLNICPSLDKELQIPLFS